MTRDRRVFALGALLGVLGVLAAQAAVSALIAGPGCTPAPLPPGTSVARAFNEQALAAIRRDLPAPTVHARNLYHVSVAMYDAWAAYDPVAAGLVVDEHHHADDVEVAREQAISAAAHRLLTARYLDAVGGSDSVPGFDALLRSRCLDPDELTATGDGPVALGVRIAEAVLAEASTDGANEHGGYVPPDGYEPVNPPLVVAESGVGTLTQPDRWQPLQIENMISQNGIPVVDGVQEFIGPHWGFVTGFALPDAGPDGVPMDPGPPPRLDDPATADELREELVEVIALSSRLDPTTSPVIDASPGARGANTLGADDGAGHERNPATGRPYPPVPTLQADLERALAEFWADGPDSETPPGHWNVLANEVSDALDPDLRIAGEGPVVDRLEWDVKLYLALNAANHDAAIAAWGLKGHYDSARPVTLIRHLGDLGQSSDPRAPAYHPDGLPLVPGLIELATADTTAPGSRHAALAGHEGEVVLSAWQGTPEDPEAELGGVGWVRAVDWVPYQLPTFVTPSFAGYVSGHSTFSHAAAVVLTEFTGDAYVPGGLGSHVVEAGSFEFEVGPATDVLVQWATYQDAADQAGRSRLHGGIHIAADDHEGRLLGAACGEAAWARARQLFGGTR